MIISNEEKVKKVTRVTRYSSTRFLNKITIFIRTLHFFIIFVIKDSRNYEIRITNFEPGRVQTSTGSRLPIRNS